MPQSTQLSKNDTCLILEDSELDEVPISEDEYNNILNIQQETLAMLAQSAHSELILAHLCQLAEKLLPNAVASIMLLDENSGLMNVISAPSIPQVGHDALQGLQPGEGGGSCGNAVFRNEAQYVKNTFEDSRWEDIRSIAYDFNLCSCWSMPVRNRDKKAIGTFALSSFEHRSPAPFHKKLLETAASIVNIVLENRKKNMRMKLFSNAMQNSVEGIIITDKNNKILEVNNAFREIYKYSDEDVITKDPKILSSHKYKNDFYKDMWKHIVETDGWSGEITNKRADGSLIEQWMSISALKDESTGDVEHYMAVFSDLTELKKSQKEIEHMAFHDTLTSLYSKTYLEYLHKGDKQATLVLLNIDNFSYVNTVYGYSVGDSLLIAVSKILKDLTKEAKVFRISSDEFAIYYENKIDMMQKISEIQSYFYEKSIDIDGLILHVTFTYGAAYANGSLLQNTALALKQAKENGKNRFHIFNNNEDTIDQTQRESFITYNNILNEALEHGNIVPYYQGIRDNKTQTITKFEVLARIEHNGKIITPYFFLEPARLSGMLPEITKVMIDKSFANMANNEFTFSLNITEDDLARNYLVDYLDLKANEYKIDPTRVILEILEGVSATGKKNHIKQLNTLKREGYSLAIDDFGVEYSNFERILDLEIDFLKIDAKYIKDIDTNMKSYEITRAIAYFAKNANIPCIAEFVHSKAVQKIVDELGIDFSQGYYFSEPEVNIESIK